jgi:ABC-type lipoprotein release transport system permease subunit
MRYALRSLWNAKTVTPVPVATLALGIVSDLSAVDPATFAIVIEVFGVTAGAATLVPARRALRVDPLVALRAE